MLTLIQVVILCYPVISLVLGYVLLSVFDPLGLQLIMLLFIVIYIVLFM